jgi:hypothetical protein
MLTPIFGAPALLAERRNTMTARHATVNDTTLANNQDVGAELA